MARKLPIKQGDVLLDKYAVEAVLGSGGMGLVVAARHLELGELFAIKVLLPESLRDPSSVERFLREARSAARLKSEHVAKVVDVGRLPTGAPYMVMEHLQGIDLKGVLGSCGPLPVHEAVDYVMQACDAIAEAHDKEIVHRDIKPANLFLAERHDGTLTIKVLDFGISKLTSVGKGSDHELTQPGTVIGSPFYVAPERFRQTREADPRSDIWALGIVLFELLTAKKPFDGAEYSELIVQIITDPPPSLASLRPDIPTALEDVVLRCLEKNPTTRYQRVRDLKRALRSVHELVRPPAPPDDESTEPTRVARRRVDPKTAETRNSSSALLVDNPESARGVESSASYQPVMPVEVPPAGQTTQPTQPLPAPWQGRSEAPAPSESQPSSADVPAVASANSAAFVPVRTTLRISKSNPRLEPAKTIPPTNRGTTAAISRLRNQSSILAIAGISVAVAIIAVIWFVLEGRDSASLSSSPATSTPDPPSSSPSAFNNAVTTPGPQSARTQPMLPP